MQLRQFFNVNDELAMWFLEMLTFPQVLQEILLEAPTAERRKIVVGLA